VATCKAIPGREFHGVAIDDAYCSVEVNTVVSGHEEYFIDIPTPEGIEKLGEAINNFILWPRWDVRSLLENRPSSPAEKGQRNRFRNRCPTTTTNGLALRHRVFQPVP
jgi:hypothetical protein